MRWWWRRSLPLPVLGLTLVSMEASLEMEAAAPEEVIYVLGGGKLMKLPIVAWCWASKGCFSFYHRLHINHFSEDAICISRQGPD